MLLDVMTEVAPAAALSAWLDPLPNVPAPSMSERMIRALEAHVAAEAQDLADCQYLAERATDPAARLLLGMIAEDEKRHHSLLQLMINRLREEIEFTPSASALPVSGENTPTDEDARMPGALRALIRDEHESARHIRHLARQDAQVYNGLYSLLLETIARDSEKHATILRYLLLRLERAH